MRPWCAEGEVPLAANLNLYREVIRGLIGIAMMNRCLGGMESISLLFR